MPAAVSLPLLPASSLHVFARPSVLTGEVERRDRTLLPSVVATDSACLESGGVDSSAFRASAPSDDRRGTSLLDRAIARFAQPRGALPALGVVRPGFSNAVKLAGLASLPFLTGCDHHEAVTSAVMLGTCVNIVTVLGAAAISKYGFGMEAFEDDFYKSSSNYRSVHSTAFVLTNLVSIFTWYGAVFHMGYDSSSYPTNAVAAVAMGASLLAMLGAPLLTLLAEGMTNNRQKISDWMDGKTAKAAAAAEQAVADQARFVSSGDIGNLKNALSEDAKVRKALLHNLYVTTGEDVLKSLPSAHLVELGRTVDAIVAGAVTAKTPAVQADALTALNAIVLYRPDNDPLKILLAAKPLLYADAPEVRAAMGRLHRTAFPSIKPGRRGIFLEFLTGEFQSLGKDAKNRQTNFAKLVGVLENLMPLLTADERSALVGKLVTISRDAGVEGFERLLPYLDGSEDLALFGAAAPILGGIQDARDPVLAARFFQEQATELGEDEIRTLVFPRIFSSVNQKNWERYAGDIEIAFTYKSTEFKLTFLQDFAQGLLSPRDDVRRFTVMTVTRLIGQWQNSKGLRERFLTHLAPWVDHDSETTRIAVADLMARLLGSNTTRIAVEPANQDAERARLAAAAAAGRRTVG